MSVDSILDGLEYLVAESLRIRRSDLATELVKALHIIADVEELRLGASKHAARASLRLLPFSLPPSTSVSSADEPDGDMRENRAPDKNQSGKELSNIVHLHSSRHPARGLHLCLEQLQREAVAFCMPFVAHLIDAASEAALQEAEKIEQR